MKDPGLASLCLLRAVVVLVAWSVLAHYVPFDELSGAQQMMLGGHAVLLCLGILTLAQGPMRRTSLVPLLLGDLLAVGAIGCWLDPALGVRIAFVTGYVVAVLVATVGHSVVSGLLGALAGAMVTALGVALYAMIQGSPPELGLLGVHAGLIAAATSLAAMVSSRLHSDQDSARVRERVKAELLVREAETSDLVALTQSLSRSSSVQEVAEAAIVFLRRHLAVRARAVLVEARGDVAGIWEEAGRLTDKVVDARRTLLQERFHAAGGSTSVRNLVARSVSGRVLSERTSFGTVVDVPVRARGRVAGLLLAGDASRGAVDPTQIGVLGDVSRRIGEALERIERQTTEENRRTSLLLRQMQEGVVLLGPSGELLLANPAARKALGCPHAGSPLPARIGEVPVAELAETPAGVFRRFRASVQTHAALPPAELACTAVGILDEAKRIGTLITLTDVTEEENARTRLFQSEKMTLVGQTLAGVAHELNNPLTALMGYSDLLRNSSESAPVASTLVKIQEQAVRATRIVKNLLSVAKQRNPERVPTSLHDLVHSVADLFSYEARLANVTIETDVARDLPYVLADTHSLQQVIVNLVQNAIHALQRHDGPREVRIEGRSLEDSVVLAVGDSGPGVPNDLRTRIFHPFFTTKTAQQGTGLGLSLARNIARDHGGELLLDRAEEGGACFVLRLPLPRVVLRPVRGDQPDLTALPFHILIVDDERDVREALVAQLGMLGCRAESTSSAAEALRMLSLTRFDAALVDVRMPGSSGIDLYHAVAQGDPEQAKRFVFMSGDFTNEDVVQGVRETGNRMIEKPFTMDELATVLQGAPCAVPKMPNPLDGLGTTTRLGIAPPSRRHG